MPTREDLILRDKSLMTRSMVLAEDAVSSIVPDLSELSSQEAGGAVRTIATGTVQQFGQVATVTATGSYQALRDIGMNDALANLIASRGRADAYLAQPIPVASVTRVDSVVGQTMKKFSQGKFVEAQSFLGQAIARVVGNIYRETQVTNSERDPMAVGYQRVASAGACSFCLTVALNQYTTFEQSGGYHTHCSCSSVPIFKGQQAYRPEYYDEFEKLYNQGRVDANSSKAGDIFRAIRRNMNRVEIPVPTVRLQPAISSGGKWLIESSDDITKRVQELSASGVQGDVRLQALVEKAGFNAKPTIVKSYDELGDNVIFRGIADNDSLTGEAMAKQFVSADTQYQGFGVFGNGSYFSTNPSVSLEYGKRVSKFAAPLDGAESIAKAVDSPNIIVAGLSDTAKVITADGGNDLARIVKETRATLLEEAGNTDTAKAFIGGLGDSEVLVANGIDVIKIENTGQDALIVFNRGALKVLG